LQQTLEEQLLDVPREPDLGQAIVRLVWACVMRAWLAAYFQLKVVGRDRLPRRAGFVLVSNHASHLDAVCLAAALQLRRVNHTFAVAAKDYFFSSFWKSVFSAVFINAVPFDRLENKRESLERCAKVLDQSGHVLIVFPEGTRSATGEIQPFKKGVGLLVAGTGRLVVPAYIDGAAAAWPKGARLPKPRRLRVVIGEPMEFGGVPRTDDGFERVAAEVEAAVRRLAGFGR